MVERYTVPLGFTSGLVVLYLKVVRLIFKMNMKKSKLPLLLIASSCLFLLCSCGDIQQEYFIHADGSGKFEASFELGEMMSMMNGFSDMGVPDDTTSDDDLIIEPPVTPDTSMMIEPEPPKDPMQLIIERVTDSNYAHDFDTLMSLDQIMPDSVKAKETRMDLFKKMALRLRSPANSSDLTMGIVMNYDNPNQLQEMMNHLDTLDSNGGVMPGAMGSMGTGSLTVYTANLKEGWIKFDSTDYSSLNQEMGMMGDSTAGSEDMGMMEMMFGNSKIRTIVHVPGEVISCTNKDAVITKDERVIIEYDVMDVMKKGKTEGFTIKFKPGKS